MPSQRCSHNTTCSASPTCGSSRARAATRNSTTTRSGAELPQRGVDCRHLKALGGRRRPRPGSPNGAWDNEAFQGYADYALTTEFAAAMEELCALASERPTAVMCAEGLWWRCHRRLIADRLAAYGRTVLHIAPDGALAEHELPPFAVPQADGTVHYPPAQDALPGMEEETA